MSRSPGGGQTPNEAALMREQCHATSEGSASALLCGTAAAACQKNFVCGAPVHTGLHPEESGPAPVICLALFGLSSML